MTSDILKRAAEAVEGVTPGPWEYRPDHGDDWGIVKVDYCVICQARDPEKLGREILAEHRETGIDPWGPNARFIAASRTLVPQLVAALEAAGADLARVTAERDADRAVMDGLAGALIWCSGSEDFNDGGKAVIGWRKLARPAIEAYDQHKEGRG